MDLAITNTWILTLKGGKPSIIKDGSIGIIGDTIEFVGSSDDFNLREADLVIDGTKQLVLPGLINSHVHTSMQLLRGGAQDLPEIEWMNKGIGPLAKHLTPKDIIIGSKLGVLEGIRTGTTTFSEYTRNVENLIKEVYLSFGVRTVATETINEVAQSDRSKLKPTDLYEFDRSKGEAALKRNEELFERFKNEDLVTCMYGPQALDMVSIDTLREIKARTVERNSKIHMHVAQGGRERIQIQGRFGNYASTVSVLNKYDFLDENLIAVHCHDTNEEERKIMVEKNAKMIGCPSSISMIDGIIPPIYDYYHLGGKVGIGTDQAPGPGNHNLFREMRTISLLTKTLLKDPTVFPSWQMLNLVTTNGANVLGIENQVGTLEVQKKADIITIDLQKLFLTPIISKPFHNFIPNLIHSATGTEVNNVIINGKLILHDNQFVNINEKEIIEESNARAEKLYERATEDWKKAGSKMVKDVEMGLL